MSLAGALSGLVIIYTHPIGSHIKGLLLKRKLESEGGESNDNDTVATSDED